MNISITFDFELFLGRRQGTVERCLVRPVAELSRIAARFGVRFVYFVDTCFLVRLGELAPRHRELGEMRDQVLGLLEGLIREGHDLQLHLHPHWRTARYEPSGWSFDMETYALPRHESAQIEEIVAENAALLRSIAGEEAVFAHRAGGWSIQPFGRVADSLARHGLWLDSSVIAGAHREHESQPFDFRGAPAGSRWRFESDPARPEPEGRFVEVPIAAIRLSPAFYWRMALARRLGGPRHAPYGDGVSTRIARSEAIRKLSRWTLSPVSIDGEKAARLGAALRRHERARVADDFVVIGHPKAMSPFSMQCLERFIERESRAMTHRFVTFRELRDRLREDARIHPPALR